MTAQQLAPVLSRKILNNTYRYGGGTVSILLAAEETGGAFSMWEGVQKPGSEPALHVHHAMDETFYLLEGRVRFRIGDEVQEAGPGDVIFAPRGIPHTFRIKSDVARAITICTPGGFEEWFRQLGQPAASFDLPEVVAPFSESDLPKILALGRKLQVEILPADVEL
jgi:quercetin dioxygenase-like cupin family protein